MVLKFAYGTVSVLVNLLAKYGVHVRVHVGNGLVLYGCTIRVHVLCLVCPCLLKVIAIPYLSIKWLSRDFILDILLFNERINILLVLGHAFHHQGI